MSRLDFGLALDFGAVDRLLAEHFESQLELVRLGEQRGFSSVWAGQSYERAAFHPASPLVVLAAIAHETRMRIGTGVILLPGWNPLSLAYDAATLDELSGGRLTLGVGLGGARLWERFGRDRATIGQWMDEALAALRALWSGESGYARQQVRIDGGVWPLPSQPGGIPLWVGGAVKRAAERAAIYGQGWYASTSHTLELIRRQGSVYREALRERNPGALPDAVVSANRLTLVAETEDEARRLGREMVGPTLLWYARAGSLGEAYRGATDAAEVFDALVDDMCVVGTPDQVIARLQAYTDAGVTHVQARVRPRGTTVDAAKRTIDLLSRYVMPAFRSASPGGEAGPQAG